MCTMYVFCAKAAYFVRCTSFAPEATYCVHCTSFFAQGNLCFRIWPSDHAMTFIVRIVRSLKYCGSVQLCDQWDWEMTDGHWRILWVRPIVRWLEPCDDFDLNRLITVRSCNESKDLNCSITFRSCDDSKYYNRSITVRSCDDSKDYNRLIMVRSCDYFNRLIPVQWQFNIVGLRDLRWL